MSYFSGFTGFTSAQYHTYNPESDVLKDVGLASYTRNSLEDFGKDANGQYDKEILEYFTNSIPKAALLCDGNFGMMQYDEDLEIYQYVNGASCFVTPSGLSAGSLLNFQLNWDRLQKGQLSTSTQEGWKTHYTYTAINNSMSGCLTGLANYVVLGQGHSSIIRIYFFSGNRQSDDRKVAINGAPTMVVVPKDSAGQPYSEYETSRLEPGSSIPASPGGPTNPDNSVAAEPLYRYDNVTKKVEFGTMQVFARLLGDLDGSKLPAVPKQQIDPVTKKPKPISTTYDDQRIKKAPTAEAMPLQAHNGNPKEFGPNSYNCTGEKQKIKVVNLTPRKYKRGELVLCSLINGMWVPMGYDVPELTPQEVPIQWSDIQKYIVDSEGLFRQNDRRFAFYQNDYEEYMRHKLYKSMLSCSRAPMWASSGNNLVNIYNWTMLNPDIDEVNNNTFIFSNKEAPKYNNPYVRIYQPSQQYTPVYDTDVLGRSLGGLREKTLLRATNVNYAPDLDGLVPSYATTFSFGMYFTDGYTVSSISRAKSRGIASGVSVEADNGNIFGLPGKDNENGEFIEGSDTLDFFDSDDLPLEAASVTNWSQTIEQDNNYVHFPAQVGIHSSGNLGVLDCGDMINKINLISIGGGGVPWETCNSYLNDERRYAHLFVNRQPAYEFVPVSPHKIQFNSLGTFSAMCGANGFSEGSVLGYVGSKFKDHLVTSAKNKLGMQETETLEPTYLYAHQRGSEGEVEPILYNMEGIVQVPFPIGDGFFYKDKNIYPRTNNPPEVAGGIGLFPSQKSRGGAYLYGVIAARGTFKGGEGIKFTVKNNWGINVVLGSTSVKDFSFGVPPAIGGGAGLASLTANTSRLADTVFYGSPDTDIDQPGGLILQARVYDHCENVIYDGRYNVPLFFNPDNDSVDFADIKNPTGTAVNSSNYKSIEIIQNPIRRGQMLNVNGFTYIKKVITVAAWKIEDQTDPNTKEDITGGRGYTVGDRVSFGGAGTDAPTVYEVDVVGSKGNIQSLKKISIGNINPGAFADGQIYGISSGSEITSQAKIVATTCIVSEILQKDYPPMLHGEATLTPDDNEGYGPQNRGWVSTTSQASINFSESKFDNQGLYDVFLMFINDVGAYPENNTGGIDPRIPDPFPFQHLSVEITSI